MNYTLNVNGKSRSVDVAPDTPMLWILRDHLDLVGAKYGCGGGFCGACTVHADGVAIRSCQFTAAEMSGKKIVTIEGLSEHGTHPLQRAWCELDVAQCGYCQAGQIMNAAELLAKHPHPTDADIDTAMAGNLCRCATYTRIRAAIHQAAGQSAT